jgi:hypothetical protein
LISLGKKIDKSLGEGTKEVVGSSLDKEEGKFEI